MNLPFIISHTSTEEAKITALNAAAEPRSAPFPTADAEESDNYENELETVLFVLSAAEPLKLISQHSQTLPEKQKNHQSSAIRWRG